MSDRKCAYCGVKIRLPHVRVWEEEEIVSRMITYCTWQHMVAHYITMKEVLSYVPSILLEPASEPSIREGPKAP